jgi:hypothetical protein
MRDLAAPVARRDADLAPLAGSDAGDGTGHADPPGGGGDHRGHVSRGGRRCPVAPSRRPAVRPRSSRRARACSGTPDCHAAGEQRDHRGRRRDESGESATATVVGGGLREHWRRVRRRTRSLSGGPSSRGSGGTSPSSAASSVHQASVDDPTSVWFSPPAAVSVCRRPCAKLPAVPDSTWRGVGGRCPRRCRPTRGTGHEAGPGGATSRGMGRRPVHRAEPGRPPTKPGGRVCRHAGARRRS